MALIFAGERRLFFRLRPAGAEIHFDASLLPYRKEILIHLAGPLAGIFSMGVTLLLIRARPAYDLFYFFFCNLFLTLLNLLPIKGLDGYHALFALFCLHTTPEQAARRLSPVHCFFSLFILCLGVGLLIKLKNPSLLFFYFMVTGKRKSYENFS